MNFLRTVIIPKFFFCSYTVLIILLVALPLNQTTDSILSDTYIVDIRLDYLGHILLFLPCLFLIRLAWPLTLIFVILFGTLFAAAAEGIQYLLPYRAFNSNDLLANLAGVLFGILLLVPAVFRRLNSRIERLLNRLSDHAREK